MWSITENDTIRAELIILTSNRTERGTGIFYWYNLTVYPIDSTEITSFEYDYLENILAKYYLAILCNILADIVIY